MSTNTQKIAYNAIISSIARVLGTILAIAIVGLSTRYLGDNDFGQYVIILAYLYIFSVLSDLGLYSIVVRDISQEKADESKIISVAFSIRFVAGILSFVLASLVVWLLPYSDTIKYSIPFAAIGFWALSNTQVLIGLFQKYLKMGLVSLAELLGRIVQLASVWLAIKFDWGFTGIIGALVLGSMATFILTYLFAGRLVKIKPDLDFIYWKKMLLAAYPLALSAVIVMVYFKANTIILSFMKPAEEVGIYGVAYKIMENLIFFPAMFIGLVVPQLAKTFKNDAVRFSRIIQKSFNFLTMLAVLILGGTFVLSGKIVDLIAGKGFEEAAGVLNILVFGLFFIFLGALFSNVIIVIEKQKVLAKIYLIGAIINVFLNLVFIPRYSYYAVASASLITEAVVTMLMIYIVYKAVNYRPALERLGKFVISAAVMAFIINKLAYLNLFFLIILSPAVYFTMLFLIKGITKEEIYEIINRRI